jgi:hypothetical protein
MNDISMIGLDLAKNVFQVHGVDASGKMVLQRQFRRRAVEKFFAKLSSCTVGMEACGSAHYWARVINRYGHEVKLMPPAYVKPYVGSGEHPTSPAQGGGWVQKSQINQGSAAEVSSFVSRSAGATIAVQNSADAAGGNRRPRPVVAAVTVARLAGCPVALRRGRAMRHSWGFAHLFEVALLSIRGCLVSGSSWQTGGRPPRAVPPILFLTFPRSYDAALQ